MREFRRKMEKSRGAAGADDARRNLERYVGRRPDEPLTIKDQVGAFWTLERVLFPSLMPCVYM